MTNYSELKAIQQLREIEQRNGGLINGNFSFVAAKWKLKVSRVRELWREKDNPDSKL